MPDVWRWAAAPSVTAQGPSFRCLRSRWETKIFVQGLWKSTVILQHWPNLGDLRPDLHTKPGWAHVPMASLSQERESNQSGQVSRADLSFPPDSPQPFSAQWNLNITASFPHQSKDFHPLSPTNSDQVLPKFCLKLVKYKRQPFPLPAARMTQAVLSENHRWFCSHQGNLSFFLLVVTSAQTLLHNRRLFTGEQARKVRKPGDAFEETFWHFARWDAKQVRTLQESHQGDRRKFEQWDGRVTVFSNCRLRQVSKYLATY